MAEVSISNPASPAGTFDLARLVRPNLRAMQAYSSARDEFQGEAQVMLDANENSFGPPLPTAGANTDPDTDAATAPAFAAHLHRYPDPLQRALKAEIAAQKGLAPTQLFLGNGSDEAIDLLVRLVCRPGHDSLALLPPTYGMYEVAATLNDVAVERWPLAADFEIADDALAALAASSAKIVFLCSPNNPSGNLLQAAAIETILRTFGGLVVVDEAYGDFAAAPSWTTRLAEFPNLVVLQTFSKAWGLAGLRLGLAWAGPALIAYLNKIKPPYNVSALTQHYARAALAQPALFEARRQALLAGRAALAGALPTLELVAHVFPSETNFLLVRFRPDATAVYDFLVARGIIVRNRSAQPGCAGCLRLTVGTPAENEALLRALREFSG